MVKLYIYLKIMFKPTYLYIKQHSITGLLYFGKTVKNPLKYTGSGIYWKRHLKEHGAHIETLWYCLFTDQESLIEFATLFSTINDIVNNESWANLSIENGLDGAPVGHPSFITDSVEVSKKLSARSKERWANPEFKERMKQIHKNRHTPESRKATAEKTKQAWTPERKARHSENMKGHPGSKKLKGIPKSQEHNRKNSEALKGKKKSAEHLKNLQETLKWRKVCRLTDRKEMSVTHFSRWLKSLVLFEPAVTHSLE